MMSERLSDRNRREREILKAAIAERLGHIGIEGYHAMPRKMKKATKKEVQGKPLTQLEISRLAHLNSAYKNEEA